MRVAAGLLHYRFWPQVQTALDALLAQTRPADVVVVLDNGSGDGSPDRIAEHYPDVEVVRVTPNRGPIGGMNAIRDVLLERDIDALLQLTHDCRLAPDALEHLAARLEEDDAVGAVGPLIAHFDSPDRLAVGGAMIDRRTWDSHAITTPAALEDWRGRPPQAVDWLAGSAILHRASAARQTGPFHADYFFYYDEPDYCLRMARQGWRIECVPAAVGWESPGAVPPYLQTRNRLEFLKRLAPRRVLAREFARIGFHVARDALRPTARAEIPARLRGVRDFARGRWGPEPKP